MRKAARQEAERFSIQKTARKTLALYRTLLGKPVDKVTR